MSWVYPFSWAGERWPLHAGNGAKEASGHTSSLQIGLNLPKYPSFVL